ncbi:MAG: hypothetical protein M1829_004411 [Trizodia sp. TS-e1964]|nr:MAG: hypothetical protein M1829_004411 [Trizodia sp. TS-e1964]
MSQLEITEGDEFNREPEPLPSCLPFDPVKISHILHCSFHFWHEIYRSITPKARLIPLTPEFLEYLREDGIVLPDDNSDQQNSWTDNDSGVYSQDQEGSEEDDDALLDPSSNFRDLHLRIKEVIAELGGSVSPKLNWSAPKDATWIMPTNSMECRAPSDIYLLLKSSDFITHDLEHPFDDCVGDEASDSATETPVIPYTLVLRKWIEVNPSVEFRCFVRSRTLIAICQREMTHFEFLFPMMDQLRSRIQSFFDLKLRDTFPDQSFAFDVYLPPPHKRVWLVDINPWAPRTDPLLFSWLELLSLDSSSGEDSSDSEDSETSAQVDVINVAFQPELRLIKRDDPEAYGFTTPQYSAHKLPKDVVDASLAGPGPLREFANQWNEVMRLQQQTDEDEVDEEG